MRREFLNALRALARAGAMVAVLALWLALGLSPAQAAHPMGAGSALAVEAAYAPAVDSPCIPRHPGDFAADHVCASCAPAIAGAAAPGAANEPIPLAIARLPRWFHRAAALQGGDVAPLYRPP